MVKDFKKVNCYFYVIKSYFLISNWYLLKYNIEIDNGKYKKKEESEEIFNHLCYLNYAYYLSQIKDERRFLKYCQYYISKKYNNYSNQNKDSNSEKIINQIKKFENNNNKLEINNLSPYIINK